MVCSFKGHMLLVESSFTAYYSIREIMAEMQSIQCRKCEHKTWLSQERSPFREPEELFKGQARNDLENITGMGTK